MQLGSGTIKKQDVGQRTDGPYTFEIFSLQSV